MKKKYLFLLLFLPLLSFGQDSSYYIQDGKIVREVRQNAYVGPLPHYVQYVPGTFGLRSMKISETEPGTFLVQLTGTYADKYLGLFLERNYKKTYLLKMNDGGTVSLLDEPVFASSFDLMTIACILFYAGLLLITLWMGKKKDLLFRFNMDNEASFPFFYFICSVFFIGLLITAACMFWNKDGVNPIAPLGLTVIVGTISIIRIFSSFKQAKKEYTEREEKRRARGVLAADM